MEKEHTYLQKREPKIKVLPHRNEKKFTDKIKKSNEKEKEKQKIYL